MRGVFAAVAVMAWWYCKWWSRHEKENAPHATGLAPAATTSTGGRPSGRGPGNGRPSNVMTQPWKKDQDPGDEAPAETIDAVEAWRFERLVEAGWPIDLAQDLARNPGVDLHYAVDLVARTSPDLAYQILT